jgi:hypothetical protein
MESGNSIPGANTSHFLHLPPNLLSNDYSRMFPRDKAAGCHYEHSFCAGLNIQWIYTFASPYVFMVHCLIEHWDSVSQSAWIGSFPWRYGHLRADLERQSELPSHV